MSARDNTKGIRNLNLFLFLKLITLYNQTIRMEVG